MTENLHHCVTEATAWIECWCGVDGLFDMVTRHPHNQDLFAERVLALYRSRPRDIGLFVRIHLVLESTGQCDERPKQKIVAELVPYRKEMKCLRESKLELFFLEQLFLELQHEHSSYSLWFGRSCVDLVERVIQGLDLFSHGGHVDNTHTAHQAWQENVTSLWDRALVAASDVYIVHACHRQCLKSPVLLALLGEPFVCLSAAYFAFVLQKEGPHIIGALRQLCAQSWTDQSSRRFQGWVQYVRATGLQVLGVISFSASIICLQVFKGWLLWLRFQGSTSILLPLVLQSSFQGLENA